MIARSRTFARAALAAATVASLAAPAPPRERPLPPIVYVSRDPVQGGQVPGLGPHGAAVRSRGRLMRREPDGHLRELLPSGVLLDVQDPDVSPDARTVIFSGLSSTDPGWRLWIVDAGGGVPRALRASRRASGSPDSAWDDVDPCWANEQIVFVRRSGEHGRAPYDGSAAGALRVAALDDSASSLLAAERGGLLDPCVDVRAGRIVYARWWFNPWRPGADGSVRDRSAGADTVNQWQIVSVRPAAFPLAAVGAGLSPGVRDLQLAAGGVPDRRAGMGVQPCVLDRGGVAAVYAANPGLAPRPGGLGVHVFGAPPSPGRRVAGAAIAGDAAHPYREGRNLASPGACAPAALPGGAMVLALDPGARGDFGLWRVSPNGTRTRLADEPGRLELDPAPLVSRPRFLPCGPWLVDRGDTTFTYENRDVFAGRGAPARVRGAVLRVWAESSPGVLAPTDVRVSHDGAVRVRLDARRASFEQLLGADGRVLAAANGPAEVRGFNTGHTGTPSVCTGCHLGHSARRRGGRGLRDGARAGSRGRGRRERVRRSGGEARQRHAPVRAAVRNSGNPGLDALAPAARR